MTHVLTAALPDLHPQGTTGLPPLWLFLLLLSSAGVGAMLLTYAWADTRGARTEDVPTLAFRITLGLALIITATGIFLQGLPW